MSWFRNLVSSFTREKEVVERVDVSECTAGWGEGVVRLVLISDTHMMHRKLDMPPGDILIHAGDFSNRGKEEEIREFDTWLEGLEYKHKVVVPGNHDTGTDKEALMKDRKQREEEGETLEEAVMTNALVLCNRMVEVEGLRVFGFPFTLDKWGLSWWAHGVKGEVEMEKMLGEFHDKSDGIDIDILVTHSPPYGVGDTNSLGQPCGSQALRTVLQGKKSQLPSLWVFGHIHECGGRAYRVCGKKTVMVNAASAETDNMVLGSVHHPVVVDIDRDTKKILNVSSYKY